MSIWCESVYQLGSIIGSGRRRSAATNDAAEKLTEEKVALIEDLISRQEYAPPDNS